MTDEKDDIFARAGLTDDDFTDDAGPAWGEEAPEPQQEAPVEAEAAAGNEAPAVAEAAPSGPARGPDGKFAPKAAAEAAPVEAPAEQQAAPEPVAPPADLNMTPAERAAWASTPPEVRAAVERRLGEVSAGFQKYVPLKPFLEHYGSPETMAQYMQGIAQFEQGLRQNPAQGFASICQALQIDPRAVAAQIIGQPEPQRDQVIDGLRQQVVALQQQVGGVQQTFEQQRQGQITQTVQQFAAANPRFDELSGDIARMLQAGFASDLQDAYDKASRLNPAPAAAPAAPPPAPPPAVQARTPAANFSVSGTPANGSNPNPRTPAKDRRDTLDWAFRQVGL